MVTVRNLSDTGKVSVRGYIDTGSDGTIVTDEVGKRLKLYEHPVTVAETMSIGGKPEERILYAAVFILRGVEIVTAVDIREDVKEVLLGRDVLQHLILSLDWKKETVEVKDP